MFNLDISPELKVIIKSMVNKSEKGCDPMERCQGPISKFAERPCEAFGDYVVKLPVKRKIQVKEHTPLLTIPKMSLKKKRGSIFEAIQSFECKHCGKKFNSRQSLDGHICESIKHLEKSPNLFS
jgi:hypothetical protein